MTFWRVTCSFIVASELKGFDPFKFIDKKEMRAVLVFHQERRNFIHMLEMHVGTMDIFDKQSVLDADFYTNIPQDNVNSIFKDRKQ